MSREENILIWICNRVPTSLRLGNSRVMERIHVCISPTMRTYPYEKKDEGIERHISHVTQVSHGWNV